MPRRQVGGVQIELRPLRPGQGPFVLRPYDEPVDVAHLELHPRLLRPTRVLPLEEMTEKPFLEVPAVIVIEFRPVLIPVHLQPLLLRGRLDEPLVIPPRMKSLAAPVGRRQERHGQLRPVRHPRPPEFVGGEFILENILAEIGAVRPELLGRQRLRTRHPAVHHGAAVPPLALPVLDRCDLHIGPVRTEGAHDAAVPAQLPVVVRSPLPRADRPQMGRVHGRHLPLLRGIVGDPVEADLAVAPGLDGRPFDAVVVVLCLPRRIQIEISGRPAAAAGVHAHAHVPVGHPLLRVHGLPALVAVRRTGRHIGMLLGHHPPLVDITVLEGQPLAVGPVGQDHRVSPLLYRPIDIGTQHETVIHRYRHVPVDPHPLLNLALVHGLCLLYCFGITGSRR